MQGIKGIIIISEDLQCLLPVAVAVEPRGRLLQMLQLHLNLVQSIMCSLQLKNADYKAPRPSNL